MYDEALAYWHVCQKLKGCYTEAGRAMIIHVEMPALINRIEHPRIIANLQKIIETETNDVKAHQHNHARI